MRGMYAATQADEFYFPKDAVTTEEVKRLLGFAESRLALEDGRQRGPLTEERKKDYVFFINATDDMRNGDSSSASHRWRSSPSSAGSQAWVRWLREEFEGADAAGRAAAEQELRRIEPHENEAAEPKWKMTIRIVSDSHSIRPKTLNAFNERISWIKLYPVDKKKDQFLMELTFPKRVSLHALWWTGLGVARSFVTALNIASLGFFWWYVPEQISHYYEKLIDLETDSKLQIGRSPALKIGWPKKALSENDSCPNSFLCFSMLPHPDKREEHDAFNHYLTGLGFMSKTDIHLQFEAQAFMAFYESLKAASLLFGDREQSEEYGAVFRRIAVDTMGLAEEGANLFGLAESLRARPPREGEVTLEHVGKMKIICDAYFIKRFQEHAVLREKQRSAAASDTSAGQTPEELRSVQARSLRKTARCGSRTGAIWEAR